MGQPPNSISLMIRGFVDTVSVQQWTFILLMDSKWILLIFNSTKRQIFCVQCFDTSFIWIPPALSWFVVRNAPVPKTNFHFMEIWRTRKCSEFENLTLWLKNEARTERSWLVEGGQVTLSQRPFTEVVQVLAEILLWWRLIVTLGKYSELVSVFSSLLPSASTLETIFDPETIIPENPRWASRQCLSSFGLETLQY